MSRKNGSGGSRAGGEAGRAVAAVLVGIAVLGVLVLLWRPWTPGPPTQEAREAAVALADSGDLDLPTGDRLAVSDSVRAFYRARDGDPLWTMEDALSPRGEALVAELRGAGREGLDWKKHYRGDAIEALLDSLDRDPSPRAMATLELTLSQALVDLGNHLATGRVRESSGGVRWSVDQEDPPRVALLQKVDEGREVALVLDSIRPTLPQYGQLIDALARYRGAAGSGDWPRVPEDTVLQPGDSAAAVARLRTRLTMGGDPREQALAREGEAAPERFDPALKEAVERFQARHTIAVDGAVGGETARALNVPPAQRVEELELNLDRIRRLPRNLGPRAVLVNVAGFELNVLENNRVVMAMAVIVGRPDWETTIFREELTHLVFNPYWNIPESIKRKEILPKLAQDPSYFQEQRLELVEDRDDVDRGDGESRRPEDVDLRDMRWDEVDPENFPWDFRQKPGPENALGRVKFLFPNEHNIYLHDTPAKALFEEYERAFSHGCIRVERPGDLARYVFENATSRPASEVDELMNSEERTRVDLDRSIPVYIVYLTSWVNRDGAVTFHPDIYAIDEEVNPELTDG